MPRTKRRGHNEGSIYKKRDKWIAAVSFAEAEGNPKRTTSTAWRKSVPGYGRVGGLSCRAMGRVARPQEAPWPVLVLPPSM